MSASAYKNSAEIDKKRRLARLTRASSFFFVSSIRRVVKWVEKQARMSMRTNWRIIQKPFQTCLAACLAAPGQKQKRDILPGDPRYGTDYHHDHHHHHPTDTVVESAKAIGGYVYSTPGSWVPLSQGLPQNIYGPPVYQSSFPLTSNYLSPVIDAYSHSSLLPTITVSYDYLEKFKLPIAIVSSYLEWLKLPVTIACDRLNKFKLLIPMIQGALQ